MRRLRSIRATPLHALAFVFLTLFSGASAKAECAALDQYNAWVRAVDAQYQAAVGPGQATLKDCPKILPRLRMRASQMNTAIARRKSVEAACSSGGPITWSGGTDPAAIRAEVMASIAKCTQFVAAQPGPRTGDDNPAQPNTNSAAQKKQQHQAATQPSPANQPAAVRPAAPAPAPRQQQSASCSDITGTGGGGGPSNCTPSSGVPANIQAQITRAQPAPPSPSRVVVLSPPQCNMCDVLKTVGEVLPDLAEKLDNIKPETINSAGPPLFDGGPNTLHPFLPRSPLAPVTELQDPLDAINDMKDIANDAKALSDLTDKNKEPEDYAGKCQDGFRDAAWKAFTAKDGSYGEKAKAAKDSLKECWKAAAKHIEDTIANGGVDSSSEDN